MTFFVALWLSEIEPVSTFNEILKSKVVFHIFNDYKWFINMIKLFTDISNYFCLLL